MPPFEAWYSKKLPTHLLYPVLPSSVTARVLTVGRVRQLLGYPGRLTEGLLRLLRVTTGRDGPWSVDDVLTCLERVHTNREQIYGPIHEAAWKRLRKVKDPKERERIEQNGLPWLIRPGNWRSVMARMREVVAMVTMKQRLGHPMVPKTKSRNAPRLTFGSSTDQEIRKMVRKRTNKKACPEIREALEEAKREEGIQTPQETEAAPEGPPLR